MEILVARPMAWQQQGDDDDVTRLQPEERAVAWVRPTLLLSALPLFVVVGHVTSLLFG